MAKRFCDALVYVTTVLVFAVGALKGSALSIVCGAAVFTLLAMARFSHLHRFEEDGTVSLSTASVIPGRITIGLAVAGGAYELGYLVAIITGR